MFMLKSLCAGLFGICVLFIQGGVHQVAVSGMIKTGDLGIG